ncbi:hypothetical protein AVEN_150490-1 [Araneus ventricosus]|uniref:Uncharacterized protein n=1 Tax=Araneus ventricosus TaxID=182803 RepID=A0A4Y2H6S4_ARAVE|nr:hypothetical protein AVEN_150490-1 [Araneus ventricosus]
MPEALKRGLFHVPPNEFCFHMANPECSLCETEHPRGPFPLGGMSYINSSADESAVFLMRNRAVLLKKLILKSFVTVVSGRKVNAQDTDNESNFTCLTQSTDLEKYMDCSILSIFS